MGASQGKFFLYYSEKDLQKLVDKFGTTDKQKLKKMMHDSILDDSQSADVQTSSSTGDQPKTEANTLDNALKRQKIGLNNLKLFKELKAQGFSLEQITDVANGKALQLPENNASDEPIDVTVETNQNSRQLLESFGNTTTHKPKQIRQEDGTLRCKNCNKKFDTRAFDFEQLDDYRIHFETVHRKLTERERDELMEIYPN